MSTLLGKDHQILIHRATIIIITILDIIPVYLELSNLLQGEDNSD